MGECSTEIKQCVNRMDKVCFLVIGTMILVLVSTPISCSQLNYNCSRALSVVGSGVAFVGVTYSLRIFFILGQKLNTSWLKFRSGQALNNNRVFFSNHRSSPMLYSEANQRTPSPYDYAFPIEFEDSDMFLDADTVPTPTSGPMLTVAEVQTHYHDDKRSTPPPPYENPPSYEECVFEMVHV